MTGSIGRHRADTGRRNRRLRTWSATLGGAVLLALGVATQVDGSPLALTSGPSDSGTTAGVASSATGENANPSTEASSPTSTAPAQPGAPAKAEAPLVAGWRGEAAVKTGGIITVRGTTRRPIGVVRLEQRVGAQWRPVTTATVAKPAATSDSVRGTWSTRITAPKTPSFQSYRAVWVHGRTTGGTVALPRLDVHRLHTYSISTRGRLASDVDDFADAAAAIYADRRGWKQAHHRFARVAKGGDFTLVLAEARTVPSFNSRCSVHYSCRSGRYVIINEKNWLNKTPAFVGGLDVYRDMVVNHETGHWLGMAHRYCPGKGRQAPVMQQQSKGLQGCTANGWPTSAELKAVTR